MKNDFYFYTTIAAGFLIVLLLGFILFNGGSSQHKYTVTTQGVEFVSDIAEPSEILSGLRESREFVVSPQFSAKGPENSYMTASLTAFNAVLIAKGKKVTVVGRVLDEKGAIASCETNLADPRTSKELGAGECKEMLSGFEASGTPIVRISFPDGRLAKPRVEMASAASITLSPSSFGNVSHVSYVFLSGLYPDAETIISNVNGVVGKIS